MGNPWQLRFYAQLAVNHIRIFFFTYAMQLCPAVYKSDISYGKHCRKKHDRGKSNYIMFCNERHRKLPWHERWQQQTVKSVQNAVGLHPGMPWVRNKSRRHAITSCCLCLCVLDVVVSITSGRMDTDAKECCSQ